MTSDPRPERPRLTIISEETPPPSQINDALVIGSAVIAALAGIGFAAGLLLGAPIEAYGTALALALLSLAFGVRRFFTAQYPEIEAVEERHAFPAEDTQPISEVRAVGRRRLLVRWLVAAGGVFGLSLLSPVPSLGPSPGTALSRTAWRRGTRLVTSGGDPIRPEDVATGGVSTVWPEGAINDEISAVILVRVGGSGDITPEPPTNLEWVVDGELVAYSKVCTHAGCPVGLFREQDNVLFCPCHQSTFDATRGARPTFGPTTRALPQLPLGRDSAGHLCALGDFQELVGPAHG